VTRAIVVGFGTTGEAVARWLRSQGHDVVVVEDAPGPGARRRASELGVELLERPGPTELASAARCASFAVVSPGVRGPHPVFGLGLPVTSEIELAWKASPAPLVAVTGTNGKTTVTMIVSMMLQQSGLRAVAAGNIGNPLIEAVSGKPDVVVAEVSSFQLALTREFRPQVAVWLNASEDHLDWHPSMEHYLQSKSRIWANQGAQDVAVANAEDPLVMMYAREAPSRLVTFGLRTGEFRLEGGRLVSPSGAVLADVAGLPRRLPHDLANALASCAAALAAGAAPERCRAVLESFEGFPHRLELVGEADGVRYYDDSKSTTPASTVAAVAGFDSVVLIAGGRNKGVDLGRLRAAGDRVRSVVAIGEAAAEVEAAFFGLRPVSVASNMQEAVTLASAAAQPGDSVILSPGCASFDWYSSYEERGEDFKRWVSTVARPARGPHGAGAPHPTRRAQSGEVPGAAGGELR
jgi:UDP-N-acetylmuramoylalanine--D-glutamate ligase